MVRATISITFFIGFLLFGFRLLAQEPITVYIDSRLSGEDKNSLKEMTSLLRSSGNFSFVFDSISRYSGKGIYTTTTDLDYYKKIPLSALSTSPEAVFIKSELNSLYIVGNSSLALKEAFFIYLEKLGFRYYTPDPLWHIVPSLSSVFKKMEVRTKPDFNYRQISMGWGEGDDNLRKQHLFWQRANCMGGDFVVNTGHAYNSLILDKKADFSNSPELLTLPLRNGNLQPGTALNYSSDKLSELTYQWIAGIFDNSKRLGKAVQMQSLEPFDGNTICELPACKALGSTATDQIIYFTNKVAARLRKSHPGKYIGLLAYNDHIDIPKYKVEENIFITLTTAFNRSNFTTEQLIDRWRTKVKSLGIYDYMSVYSWDFDTPGRGLAGNYKLVEEALKFYHKKGVKTYIAESTYGWINKAIGHYIASKLLWNINANVSELVDEFFENMFPQTKQEMRKLFEEWIEKATYFSDEDLYQWHSLVRTAFLKCSNSQENQRLEQIAAYLHYVVLRKDYVKNSGSDTKAKGSALFAYMWKLLPSGIIPSYAGLNEAAGQLGPEFSYNNKDAVWKQSGLIIPKSKEEWIKSIESFMSASKRVTGFKSFAEWTKIAPPVANELNLPSSRLNLSKEFTIQNSLKIIADLTYRDSLFFKITVGRLKKQGAAELKVYPWNDSLKVKGQPIKKINVKADWQEVNVDLSKLPAKKYILIFSDNGAGSKIYFPGKMKFSVVASEKNPIQGGFYNSFYFFVPKGTTKFYIAKAGHIRLHRPLKGFTDYETNIDMLEVNVNDNEYGWWIASLQLSSMYFIGIPPFVTQSPQSYMFPK